MPETATATRSWISSDGRADGFAEGMALGMIEARRAAVLRGIQLRFGASAPPELAALIRGTKDLDLLGQWLDAMLLAPDLGAFRGSVQHKIGA